MSRQTSSQPPLILEPIDEDLEPALPSSSNAARGIVCSLQTLNGATSTQFASFPQRLSSHILRRSIGSTVLIPNDRRTLTSYVDSVQDSVATTPQTAYDPGWHGLRTASERDLEVSGDWQDVEVNVENGSNWDMLLDLSTTEYHRGNSRHAWENELKASPFYDDGRGGLDESAGATYSRLPSSFTPPYPCTISSTPYSPPRTFTSLFSSTALGSPAYTRSADSFSFRQTDVKSLVSSPYPQLPLDFIESQTQDRYVLGGVTDASIIRSRCSHEAYWDVADGLSQQSLWSARCQQRHGSVTNGPNSSAKNSGNVESRPVEDLDRVVGVLFEGGEQITQRQPKNGDDPRGIGFTGNVEPDGQSLIRDRWCVRTMRWRKTGNIWRGSWIWTHFDRVEFDWKSATWTDQKSLDQASHLPQEILIHIAMCACDTIAYRKRTKVSMVCREWRRICFRDAMSRLRISKDELADFTHYIRHARNGSSHRYLVKTLTLECALVKTLTLECALVWQTFHHVGRFLGPEMELLRWRGNDLSSKTDPEFNFPSLHAATVQIRTSFVKLRRLSLENCRFSSTTDLLRLIASLPLLLAARLVHVRCQHLSQGIIPRRPTSRPLRLHITPWLGRRSWLFSLAQSWLSWPVSPGDDCPKFSGNSPVEAIAVATIVNCLDINAGAGLLGTISHTWSLSPSMDPVTGLYTLWIARFSSRNVYTAFSVLFHVSTTAHVFQVIIGGQLASGWQANDKARAMTKLDEALHALPHLRQVILQSTKGNADFVRKITKGLVRVRDKLLVMPKGEYEQFTFTEKLKDGVIPDPCPILPPLWVEKPEVYEDDEKW